MPRPKVPKNFKMDKRLVIPLTEGEDERIRRAAFKLFGGNASELGRVAINEYLSKQENSNDQPTTLTFD